MTYVLTRKAQSGLLKILDYVGNRFDVETSIKVLDRIEGALHLLCDNPSLGHDRPDITQRRDVKFWSVGPTLIAYRVTPEHLEVLVIERSSRDWPKWITQ